MAARTRVNKPVEQTMYEPVSYEAPREPRSSKGSPVLGIVLGLAWAGSMGLSFMTGSLFTKVKYLENQPTNTAANQMPAAAAPVAKASIEDIKALFGKNLIKFGDANKKNLFVEVADPSCPYCHAAAGNNPELNKEMGAQFILASDGGSYVPPVKEMRKLVESGQAGFVYVYFPGHGTGEMGTKAMYCAFDMGKFWPVHDLIMSKAGYDLMNTQVKNDKTKSADIANFLKSVADVNTMKSCIDSGKYDVRLTEETQIGTSLGVSGTPGFFVNETNFAGAYGWDDMKGALN